MNSNKFIYNYKSIIKATGRDNHKLAIFTDTSSNDCLTLAKMMADNLSSVGLDCFVDTIEHFGKFKQIGIFDYTISFNRDFIKNPIAESFVNGKNYTGDIDREFRRVTNALVESRLFTIIGQPKYKHARLIGTTLKGQWYLKSASRNLKKYDSICAIYDNLGNQD